MEQDNIKLFSIENKYLLGFLKPMKDLIIDFRINLNQYGFNICEISPDNVSLMDINIKKELLGYFNIDYIKQENPILCFNSDSFYKLLKDFKKEDITFYINTEKTKIFLSFSNGFNSEIDLINMEESQKSLIGLNLNFDISLNMDSIKFKEIIKQYKKISESVKFELNKEGFFINSSNNLFKSGFKCENIEVLKNENPLNKSFYALEFLNKFIVTDISEKVKISFSNDYPLKLNYINQYWDICFILSPRIEGEN